MSQKYTIELIDWQHPAQPQLKAIRQQVFIIEQQVPVDLEWDEHDKDAMHLLVLGNNNQPVGCARIILKQAKIGRMAVLNSHRKQGIGRMLLDEALKVCQLHTLKQVSLSAQTSAISFYQKAGFNVTSQPYLDANILHVDMQYVIK